MSTTVIVGTGVTWSALELKNQFVAKGYDGTKAGYADCLIQYLTGGRATAAYGYGVSGAGGHFSALGKNAGLILALEALARPVTQVARSTWKVLGTAGTTAPTAAAVIAWIKTNPIKWQFDDNDPNKQYGRPEYINDAASIVIADIVHGWLGDAATNSWTGAVGSTTNGPLVISKLTDDDVNSPTYSGLSVAAQILTPDQYGRAVFAMFQGLIKVMRYFATGSVQYPQYLSNNYPNYNQGPVLDDTNKST